MGSVLLKPAHLTSEDEWQRTITVNLSASFAIVKAAAKVMRQTGGSVVLCSSAAARIGLANHEAIAAAKEKVGAKVVILAQNNTGKALAPRLSVRLKAGLAAGVTALPESADPLVVSKKVFSGKANGKVKILSGSAILPLAQNSYEITSS